MKKWREKDSSKRIRKTSILVIVVAFFLSQIQYQWKSYADGTDLPVVTVGGGNRGTLELQENIIYEINNSMTISGSNGQAGIEIPKNYGSIKNYYLRINADVTVYGASASGSTPATAGIRVPENTKLTILGSGKLTSIGGNGANGSNGSGGTNAFDDGTSGGRGGNGGGGAGAGIGGNGGAGGNDSGAVGNSGENAGNIEIQDTVTISAKGGTGGSGGSGGAGGGSKMWSAILYTYMKSGAGGGGGGGGGYPAAGIGGGGAGGGAGGRGGDGTESSANITDFFLIIRVGGSGGGGGAGYGGGGGGTAGKDVRGIPALIGSAIFDGTNNQSTGSGASAGNVAGNGDETVILDSKTEFSGERGYGAGSNTPGRGGSRWAPDYKSGSNAQAGGIAGDSGNGGSYIRYRVTTSYSGALQLVNNVYANAQKIGSGGGVRAGSSTEQATLFTIDDVNITVDPPTRQYNGDTLKPEVKVTDKRDGRVLKNTCYTLTYPDDFLNAGDYQILVTGNEDFVGGDYISGNKSVSYSVTKGEFTPIIGLSSSKVTAGDKVVATILNNDSGAEATWTVMDDTADVILDKNVGNSITIDTNIQGSFKLKVTIPETQNYKAASGESSLIEVTPVGVDNFQISGITDKEYTGSPVIQDGLVVKFRNKVLKIKKDYRVVYSNNINAGAANMKIIGMGDYDGELDMLFYINRTHINKTEITKPNDLLFTGKEQTSQPTVTFGGKSLTEGKDYTLTYNQFLTGEVTVTVVGRGNFIGSTTTTYTIQPADINTLEGFYIEDIANQTYTSEEIKPKVAVSFNGKYLSEGIDYSVDFSSNIKAGVATATITGMGSYKSTMSKQFTIDKAALYVQPNEGQYKYAGDLTDPEFEYTITGILGSDHPLIKENTSLQRVSGENIGTYELLIGTLALEENGDSANYTLALNNKVFFEIRPFDIDEEAILEGTLGSNGWYRKEKVKIKAPEGYVISILDDPMGEWKEYITVSDGDYSEGMPYYLRQADGKQLISQVKYAKFKQDTVDPGSRIEINRAKAWVGMFPFPKFTTYFSAKNPVSVEVHGDDDTSLIEKVERFTSEDVFGEDELKAFPDSKWTEGEEFEIADDGQYIVYSRITDKAGNVSYGRSDGFIVDSIDPYISYTYDLEGTWTSKEQPEFTVHIGDDESGLKDRYVDFTIEGNSQLIELDADGNANIKNLPDGDYDVTLSAQDNSGNMHYVTVNVKIDRTTPIMTVTGNTTDYATEQPIALAPIVGASGVDKVYLQYVENLEDFDPDGAWTDITADYRRDKTYTAHKNGFYYFKVKSVVGLESTYTSIAFSHIDKTKPVVDVKAVRTDKTIFNENDWANQEVKLTIRNGTTNIGNSIFEYKVDGGNWAVMESPDELASTAMSKSGKHIYTFRITSNAGVVSDELEYRVNIDKVAPNANMKIKTNSWSEFLNTITGGLFFNETIDIDIEASDKDSKVKQIEYFHIADKNKSIYNLLPKTTKELEEYVDDHGGWKTGDHDAVATDNKYHVAYGKVTDYAGNVTYVSSEGFALDNEAPTIDIQFIGNEDFDGKGTWITAENGGIEVAISDSMSGIDKVTYQITGQDVIDKDAAGHFNITDLEDGTYDITIIVSDKAGNTVNKVVSLQVDKTDPDVKLVKGNPDYYASYQDIQVEPVVGASGLNKVEVQYVLQGAALDEGAWRDITATYGNPERITEKGTYYARVTNGLGKVSKVRSWKFDRIEYIEPSINGWLEKANGSEVAAGSWLNGNDFIAFENDPHNVMNFKYEYAVNGGAMQDASSYLDVTTAKVPVSLLPEGENSIEVRVGNEDKDGVWQYSSTTLHLKVDTTKPSANLLIGTSDGSNVPGSEDIKTTNFIDNNTIQNFYGTEKSFYLEEVKDKDVDNSGVASISYYIQRSALGEYLEEYPLGEDKVEEFVGSRWTTMSINAWNGMLESGITSNKLADLSMRRSYIIYAKITDVAGNSQYISSPGFALDNSTPVIATDYKEDSWYGSDDDKITVTLEECIGGIGSGWYEINGVKHTLIADEIKNNRSFEIPVTAMHDGENTLKIGASSVIGNAAEDVELTIKKDTQEPQVALSGDTASYAISQNITITPTLGPSGLQKVEVSIDDGKWKDITQTYKDGYLAEKNGIYSFRITNGAKKVSSITSIIFDRIESDPPELELDTEITFDEKDPETYESGTWTNKTVNINVKNMSENYGEATYQYIANNQGSWQVLGTSSDPDDVLTLKEENPGIHNYQFMIRSELGLESHRKTVDVKIDKQDPIIKGVEEQSTWTNEESQMTIKAEDDLSGFGIAAYSFDGGQTFSDSPKTKVADNGALEVVVRDNAGNVTKAMATVAHIDRNAPSISEARQDSEEWKKNKRVSATVTDALSTDTDGTSGVASVFITSHNPYSGNDITRLEPEETDIVMRNSNGGNIYTTSKAIDRYLGEVDGDNYWVVAIDEAGNATATSLTVSKIDGVKTPDNKPEDPNDGNQGGNGQDGNHQGGNGSGDINGDIGDINDGIQDVEDGKSDDIKNDLTDLLDKIEEILRSETLTEEQRIQLEAQRNKVISDLIDYLLNEKIGTDKNELKNSLDIIDKLLARDDLTDQQRELLLARKALLEGKYEELVGQDEKQKTLVYAGLGFLVIIIVGGSLVYSRYMKKKTEELEEEYVSEK